MSEGPPSIALVVEAPADAQTAARLIDRVLLEVDWIEEDSLDYLRAYVEDPLQAPSRTRAPTLVWKRIPKLCAEHGVRVQGKFDGTPGAPDARAARRALLLLKHLAAPDAVVLLRDADSQPERLEGLRQARADGRHGLDAERVAIGVAIPEREAWHLCGFSPEDESEQTILAAERQRLGFDPTAVPHELRGEGKRSAKRAMQTLCGMSDDRERRCLDAPLEQLRARGEACGLSEFLSEIGAHVVPAISGHDRR